MHQKTTTHTQQPIYGPLSGTSRVSRYQKKHSPTHHPDHHPIFISFFHLTRSIASFLFKLCALQSFCTTSLHVLFGLPLGLEPSTSYSIHFFTQSVSSFRNTSHAHTIATCFAVVSTDFISRQHTDVQDAPKNQRQKCCYTLAHNFTDFQVFNHDTQHTLYTVCDQLMLLASDVNHSSVSSLQY